VRDGRPSICVVSFPGMNCEDETRRAVLAAGASCDVVPWNAPASSFTRHDGFVLPGGFSYQDRVRAGAIAAKDAVMALIAEEAGAGKAVLGICNGAQILLESGLVPATRAGRVEMGLARNAAPGRDGYLCAWASVRVETSATCATCALGAGEVLPIPFAHAEGRFVTSEPGLVERLLASGQVVLRYVRPDGSPARGFPDNPNGSVSDIAAIANPRGNVVAMMPHPERAARALSVPEGLGGPWGALRSEARRARIHGLPGPGADVFLSLVRWCSGRAGA
jgi:phosphoribosylformylglycinamidine synthase I